MLTYLIGNFFLEIGINPRPCCITSLRKPNKSKSLQIILLSTILASLIEDKKCNYGKIGGNAHELVMAFLVLADVRGG